MIYIEHIAPACGSYSLVPIELIGTLLSFFMAWFFFKGGMMHKKQSTKEIVRKSTKRLLVPYLFFLLLGFFIDLIIKASTSEFGFISFTMSEIMTFMTTSVLGSTAAIWFLLSLFVVRILFNFSCCKIHPLLLTLIFTVIGYLICTMNESGCTLNIHFPGYTAYLSIPTTYMGNMCHGLAIYSIGFYLKEKQFKNNIFIVASIIFMVRFLFPAVIHFRGNDVEGTNYILAVVYEISGCVTINNIFKRLVNRKIPQITYIGNNSMVYYLIHYPVLSITIGLFWTPFANYDLWMQFFILSLIVTMFLILADYLFRIKRLRFIIGG